MCSVELDSGYIPDTCMWGTYVCMCSVMFVWTFTNILGDVLVYDLICHYVGRTGVCSICWLCVSDVRVLGECV